MKKKFYSVILTSTFLLSGCANNIFTTENFIPISEMNEEQLIVSEMSYIIPQLRHTKMRIKRIDNAIVVEAPTTVFFANNQYSAFNPEGVKQLNKLLNVLEHYPQSRVDITVHTGIKTLSYAQEYITNSQAEQIGVHVKKFQDRVSYHGVGSSQPECAVNNLLSDCILNRVKFSITNNLEQ